MNLYKTLLAIQNVAWFLCKPEIYNYTTKNPYLSAYLKLLIVQKRCAGTNWHRSKYPTDKTIYNNLCILLKRQMVKQRAEQFTKQISPLSEKVDFIENHQKIFKKLKISFPLKKKNGDSLAINDKVKQKHLDNTFLKFLN